MFEKEWINEVSASLEGTRWSVFSAGCAPDSSDCYAHLTGPNNASKTIELSLDLFHTTAARIAEIKRQLLNTVLRDARPNDRVVFERADGLFDVENVVAARRLQTARSGLKSFHEAYEIALGHKESGGRVWVRHHATPDLIERFNA